MCFKTQIDVYKSMNNTCTSAENAIMQCAGALSSVFARRGLYVGAAKSLRVK